MSEAPPPGWVPPSSPSSPPPPGYAAPGSAPGQPGYGPAGYGAPVWLPPVHKPGVVALRPLGLGDVFDGSFKTIRANPKAMIGLSALVTTAFLVLPTLVTLGLAALGELSFGLSPMSEEVPDESGLIATYGTTLLGALFGALAAVVLNGMLVFVVSEAVLGRKTTIGATWAATRPHVLRLFGLALLSLLATIVALGVPVGLGFLVAAQAGTGAGVATGSVLAVAGVLLLVFGYIRWLHLAAPALVLEKVGVVEAMRRAGRMSHRQWWRLFGIYLLAVVVAGFVGQILSLPLGLLATIGPFFLPPTAGALAYVFSSYLSQILVAAVVTPFTSAVVALQYVDQRIRKEGLDVQLIAAAQHSSTGTR